MQPGTADWMSVSLIISALVLAMIIFGLYIAKKQDREDQ